MTLLNPLALAWAAIALPIIGLYILRIRRRRQLVPTLMFWDQIFQDTAPRSLWRRLRHWLSLLMQLAFLSLLALALAEPAWTTQSRKPVHYIVVLDQSASMRATDGEPTRLDQARGHALEAIDAMREQDQATVIGAGLVPTIVCGRTHHQPTLRKVIDSIEAADARADLRRAVDLARSVDVGQDDRVVVVISDAQGVNGLSELLEGTEGVAVRICGRQEGNLAIVGLAVRPRADNPLELQGMLRLGNYTDGKRTAQVRLTLDDELFDVVLADLEAGEEKVHAFRLVHTGGRILRARLTEADALSADNVAVAVLPEISRKKVLLITSGDLFLESVLQSHPWMEVSKAAPDAWATAATDADLLVFDGHVPEVLPAKPSVYLYPVSDSRLWTLGEEIKNPIVSDLADDDSKILRHVHLHNCTFHRARSVTPDKAAHTMVSSFEHPLLLRWADASPPVVLLAVSIKASESDLPWRTAFPILMQNVLNYLSGSVDEPVSSYRTIEPAVLSLKPDDGDINATDETGSPVIASWQEGGLVVGPVRTVGVVRLRAGDKEVPLAFNLADSRESNLRATPTTQPVAGESRRFAGPVFSWPWWLSLVIVAIGLSVTEWGLHQRRAID